MVFHLFQLFFIWEHSFAPLLSFGLGGVMNVASAIISHERTSQKQSAAF